MTDQSQNASVMTIQVYKPSRIPNPPRICAGLRGLAPCFMPIECFEMPSMDGGRTREIVHIVNYGLGERVYSEYRTLDN